MGLIDGGLAIREGGQLLKGTKAAEKILSNGGADVVAKLTPEQTRKFQTLAASTDEAQKQQLRQSLRQELGDDFDAANKVFEGSKLETISDAEADLVYGGFTKSEYDGRTYDSLSLKEKEAFDQTYNTYNLPEREAVGKPEINHKT